ncbi:hypothetical protein NESM_000058100 [Novymonas esmeraldas]|uniref:Uncharacterized protein n=1 Tax=Novymonas esmeraldas TaxID=1808958 RepID=A0AAW0F1Q0_9TRYP
MQGKGDAPVSCGGTLQIRTTLLESVRRYNESCLTEAKDADGANAAAAAAAVTAEESSPTSTAGRVDKFPEALPRSIAQLSPGLTNPAWAMEECVRLCPAAELWCGSALPKEVWAAPGTPECPFGTDPVDFHAHR